MSVRGPSDFDARKPRIGPPILVGALAAIGLLAFYLTVVTLASGREFAREQLAQDAKFFAFLLPAFGTQVGLYAYFRALVARGRGAAAAAGANGGVSGAAMVACCAHFLPTLLPFVGVSGLATLLTGWKTPLLVLAIASNVAGIAYVSRAIRHARGMRSGALPARAPSPVDPVCGMSVEENAPERSEFGGRTFRFCSTSCRERFDSDPSKFAA